MLDDPRKAIDKCVNIIYIPRWTKHTATKVSLQYFYRWECFKSKTNYQVPLINASIV